MHQCIYTEGINQGYILRNRLYLDNHLLWCNNKTTTKSQLLAKNGPGATSKPIVVSTTEGGARDGRVQRQPQS